MFNNGLSIFAFIWGIVLFITGQVCFWTQAENFAVSTIMTGLGMLALLVWILTTD